MSFSAFGLVVTYYSLVKQSVVTWVDERIGKQTLTTIFVRDI